MTNNIKTIISNNEIKMKKLNKIAFSFYGKTYPYLDKEKQKEIEEIYNILIEEENNINLNKYNISSAYNDMSKYIELKKNNGVLGRSILLDWKDGNNRSLNKLIEGIIYGKTYTISGYTNTGKSMFLYFLLNRIELKPDEKVFIFSTEVNKGLLLKYLVQSKYGLNNNTVFKFIEENIKEIEKEFNNFYIFDDVRDIDIIEKIVKKEKPSIVVIDFVQGLKTGNREGYEKHSYIALKIQQIGIENNATMINVAQINASALREARNGGVFTIKGAGEYLESSDVVLNLIRLDKEEPQDLILNIEKNKFGPLSEFYIKADFSTVNFEIDNNSI